MPIIKRRSWGFQNTLHLQSLHNFKPSYGTSKKAGFWLPFSKSSIKIILGKRNGSIPYGDHQCSELKSVFSKKQGKCVQKKEYYIKTQLGHSAYFNTAVTKQDFMKILGVSSQKWCKIISYYHGDVKQTMVYLIAPSVLILIKWDVTKQDFFLVLWHNTYNFVKDHWLLSW